MNEDHDIENKIESVEVANSTSESEVVISVNQLSKIYKLYPNNEARLKEALHPLRKKYHTDFYALNNISFNVHKGEVLGIIGANGSGKSTLLMAIAGILQPNSGSVIVNGRISSLIELGSGFNPEFTGMENIYFMGSIIGYTKQEMDGKVKDITAFADIGEFIYQPVKTYSSGMMARLAFSLALLVDPDILIIDEALSVGDVRFQQKAIRAMTDLMGRAKVIIFVTHSLESVRKLCNRVIWLNNGSIFQDGKPKEITKNYYDFMTIGQIPNIKIQNKDKNKEQKDKENYKFSVIEFDDISSCESVGDGRAFIEGVALYTEEGDKVYQLEGGEEVNLYLKIKIYNDIENPSIGMHIKNSLGMNIFGISTSSFQYEINSLSKDETIKFKMRFTIPKIINGDYALTVAVSDYMDIQNKIKVHVIYDALLLKILGSDIKQKHSSLIIPEKAEFSIF